MFPMGARRTGRSTLFTVIVRDFVSLSAPVSVARTLADAVPESANPGARWMLPVVALVVVTVAYVGPDTSENVRASPSGSVPVMAWSAVAFSFTVMFAG